MARPFEEIAEEAKSLLNRNVYPMSQTLEEELLDSWVKKLRTGNRKQKKMATELGTFLQEQRLSQILAPQTEGKVVSRLAQLLQRRGTVGRDSLKKLLSQVDPESVGDFTESLNQELIRNKIPAARRKEIIRDFSERVSESSPERMIYPQQGRKGIIPRDEYGYRGPLMQGAGKRTATRAMPPDSHAGGSFGPDLSEKSNPITSKRAILAGEMEQLRRSGSFVLTDGSNDWDFQPSAKGDSWVMTKTQVDKTGKRSKQKFIKKEFWVAVGKQKGIAPEKLDQWAKTQSATQGSKIKISEETLFGPKGTEGKGLIHSPEFARARVSATSTRPSQLHTRKPSGEPVLRTEERAKMMAKGEPYRSVQGQIAEARAKLEEARKPRVTSPINPDLVKEQRVSDRLLKRLSKLGGGLARGGPAALLALALLAGGGMMASGANSDEA